MCAVVRCCKHGNCYDTVEWCAVVVNMVMVSNMYGGVCGNIVGEHLVVFTVKQATFVQCNTAVGKRRERDNWGDLGVVGWIILGRISRRWYVGIWTGLVWPRIETGGGRL